MSKSIYPSIPSPGTTPESQRATLDAMRQTLTMVIMNAQKPNPNFAPSSASQVFVTQDALKSTGVVGTAGPAGPQGPPGPGISEAPNDTHYYARHQLGWDRALEDRIVALEAKFPQTANMVQAATTPDTTSTTYVMQGINLIVSSAKSPQAWVTVDGQLTNANNNGQTNAVLCYGTGTPPANGAAQIGTILTQPATFVSALGTGRATTPFSLSAVVTGIAVGAPYWIDLAVSVSAGSRGNVTDINLTGHGIA